MSKTFSYFIPILAAMAATAVQAGEPLRWTGWSEDLFARAKAQNRFVILDLEAVWCHWCHVMDQNTYANPKVQALLRAKYIPVRVDQDSDPALSARYGDWGWPATIVFGPEGKEIVKLRGYVEPDRMAAMLRAIIDDPAPGPSVAAEPLVAPSASWTLSKSERAALAKTYDESYDGEHAGWGADLKYIDADSMDYAFALAGTGDKAADARARQTFEAALALIDPIWGGVYQYSVDGGWTSPHFEKIISFQTQYIRQYAQAYLRWRDERYRSAARAMETYLTTFLMSPDGAFYVSQDADLDKDSTATNITLLATPAGARSGCRASTRTFMRAKMAGLSAPSPPTPTRRTMHRRSRSPNAPPHG